MTDEQLRNRVCGASPLWWEGMWPVHLLSGGRGKPVLSSPLPLCSPGHNLENMLPPSVVPLSQEIFLWTHSYIYTGTYAQLICASVSLLECVCVRAFIVTSSKKFWDNRVYLDCWWDHWVLLIRGMSWQDWETERPRSQDFLLLLFCTLWVTVIWRL